MGRQVPFRLQDPHENIAGELEERSRRPHRQRDHDPGSLRDSRPVHLGTTSQILVKRKPPHRPLFHLRPHEPPQYNLKLMSFAPILRSVYSFSFPSILSLKSSRPSAKKLFVI